MDKENKLTEEKLKELFGNLKDAIGYSSEGIYINYASLEEYKNKEVEKVLDGVLSYVESTIVFNAGSKRNLNQWVIFREYLKQLKEKSNE